MENRELNFTKVALASLPVPPVGKRAYYRDSKTRGLAVSITDKGTRSFIFYRKIEGRPERILIGRLEEISIEQARNKAASLNAAIAAGHNPADTRRTAREELTLRELFSDYFQRHAKIHVKYCDQYAAQFRMHFCTPLRGRQSLGDQKISRITRADIAEVHAHLTRQSKPITANRVLAMISSVFSWAVRAGIVEKNIAHGIRKNGETAHARDRFLLPAEMPRFFEAVAAHGSNEMRDYVLLSLLTGQRQANVLAMEWSEVDFPHALWRIPKAKTKTAREYVVPLTSTAVSVLDERRQKRNAFCKFVLPGTGKTGHFAEPKKGWKRILHRAELFGILDALAPQLAWTGEQVSEIRSNAELDLFNSLEAYRAKAIENGIDPGQFRLTDLRMHDLRRTLASWQAMTGANLVAISKTMNHSNVATTSIYARLQSDPVRDAIQVATGAMFLAAGKGGETIFNKGGSGILRECSPIEKIP